MKIIYRITLKCWSTRWLRNQLILRVCANSLFKLNFIFRCLIRNLIFTNYLFSNAYIPNLYTFQIKWRWTFKFCVVNLTLSSSFDVPIFQCSSNGAEMQWGFQGTQMLNISPIFPHVQENNIFRKWKGIFLPFLRKIKTKTLKTGWFAANKKQWVYWVEG